GSATGLGVLPLATRFEEEKITRPTELRFTSLPAPWSELSGIAVRGYEIRHGRTSVTAPLDEAAGGGLGYVRGSVLAVYAHGMFDAPAILSALVGIETLEGMDHIFEVLADAAEAAVD